MESTTDYQQQLASAMRSSANTIYPPIEELVRGALVVGGARRQRRARVWMGVAAGVVALAAAGVAVGPRLGGGGHPAPAPVASSSSPAGCAVPVRTDPLPSWATAGFSDPKAPGNLHVIGAAGRITAILFGPLSAPEAKNVGNKVLWVARISSGPAPLIIDARLAGSTQTVRREVPTGPGPSYLELPSPGCWHLSLSWDGGQQQDSLNLTFSSPA